MCMRENRSNLRKRILKAGRINFGFGSIDCVVRNISETGASLEVESPVGVPERFELLIVADRCCKSCKVVWRKERRVGVHFE